MRIRTICLSSTIFFAFVVYFALYLLIIRGYRPVCVHLEFQTTLIGHAAAVTAIAVSTDGTTLASASQDNTIKVWDLKDKKKIITLIGHASLARTLQFSPDMNWLASGSSDHTVKLWNLKTGEVHASFSGNWMAFSPDGRKIAVAMANSPVKLYDVLSARTSLVFRGTTPSVHVLLHSTQRAQFLRRVVEMATTNSLDFGMCEVALRWLHWIMREV